MTKIDRGSDPLVLVGVEKQYGGLRPLRIRDLRVPAGLVTMLVGFDRPSAETFINLVTGATLPEAGDVSSLGRLTRDIVDSEEWLSFVERFGIVSDRVVLLEAMTVEQNLAIAFDLEIDPVPSPVRARVAALADEVGIDESLLSATIGAAGPLLRARVHLARALAFDPAMLILEHPAVTLSAHEAGEYAAVVKRIHEIRRVTIVGLMMDEAFAKATGGRRLFWQPATGDLRERSALRFW